MNTLKVSVPHINYKAIILILIVICAYYEIFIGLMQLVRVVSSHHPYYKYTGTFYNPGPYACFLAISFPIAFRCILISDSKLLKWLCMGMVIVCAILIPATLSRTACVACCIGGAVVLYPIMFTNSIWSKRSRLIIPTIVMGVALATGAYFIKKDSAEGRFLMWKIASHAVMNVPSSGVGWANVAGVYGEAQERYFASGHGSEAEMMVADAPEYTFNEYLQVAIAFGPLVAGIMTAIMAGGVIVAIRNKEFGFAGAGLAVMVVMSASYPLQFPLFVTTIGLIIAGCYLTAQRIIVKVGGCVAVIISCAMFYTHNQTVDVRNEFLVGHTLHNTGDFRKSNKYMLKLLSHSSDPMILNIIGKNYQSLGIPDSAEYYLRKSVNRCPNRLYPHYLLMLLHADSASYNREALAYEAEILMNKKVKIPSPAVDEMQAKAREILERLK